MTSTPSRSFSYSNSLEVKLNGPIYCRLASLCQYRSHALHHAMRELSVPHPGLIIQTRSYWYSGTAKCEGLRLLHKCKQIHLHRRAPPLSADDRDLTRAAVLHQSANKALTSQTMVIIKRTVNCKAPVHFQT